MRKFWVKCHKDKNYSNAGAAFAVLDYPPCDRLNENIGYINAIDTATVIQEVEALREDLKLHLEIYDELCSHLSKAEYTVEELKKPFDIGEPLRDGTLAIAKAMANETLTRAEKFLKDVRG